MKQLAIIFFSVFVAEIGDKTQLATLLFATNPTIGRFGVFCAAAAALVAITGVNVFAGDLISQFIRPSTLKVVAGAGFIAVGIWTLISGLATSGQPHP